MFLPAPDLDLDQLDPGASAREIRILRDESGLAILLLDHSGQQVAYHHVDGEQAEFLLERSGAEQATWDQESVATAKEVSKVSRALLSSVSGDAISTAKRLTTSFDNFIKMLWFTFGFGVLAFGAAVLRGMTAADVTDVVVAGIFGGLSASTFVATFIARPTGAMGDAGPRAAWVQGIVTTYWSKLAYMSDPGTVLKDLDEAQQSMTNAMKEYARTFANDSSARAEAHTARDAAGGSSSTP